MWTSRMCFSSGETAPAVDHRSIVAKSYRSNDLILHSGIAVDRLVNRRMKGDDLLNATHIVTEPVYEGGVLAKERGKCRHLVTIPCSLELLSHFLRSLHRIILSMITDARSNKVHARIKYVGKARVRATARPSQRRAQPSTETSKQPRLHPRG